MSCLSDRKSALPLGSAIALLVLMAATSASAETLLMPKRDYLMGVSEVVWGVTTQANGTAFVLDYGDGSAQQTGGVADRSYIAFNHTYANSGPMTVQLCVGAGAAIPGCTGELASVQVNVYNGALLTPENLRGLNINRTIQDGLRFLWTQIQNRAANFPASNFAFWTRQSFTALVVLAFENHGYKLTNDDVAPTGLYEKYVVQRGLNQVLNGLTSQTLTVQTNLGSPCVGPGIEPAPCLGYQDFSGDVGYATAIASLPFAGSSSLARHAGAFLNANVAGKTYGEILQRILNTVAFNQIDGALGPNRGGWAYGSANNSVLNSDSSVVGWDLLALFDGEAAGAVLPALIKSEFGTNGGDANLHALDGHRNSTDGSFDYSANTSEVTSDGIGKNLARTAIGLQGLHMVGELSGPRVDLTVAEMNLYMGPGTPETPPAGSAFACQNNGKFNKGCGYGMFNTFKALKLYGITTLPNVNRPAGSIGDPDDWYEDYRDYLVANQVNPTSQTGGQWQSPGLVFSSSASNVHGETALAELILAPVALIAPDPGLFSTVGLSPQTDTNPVNTPHTVTAFVQSSGGQPIPGATVGFNVLSGPNAGASGVCNPASCVSPASGLVSWTYMGGPNIGNDKIQANIGTLLSNIVDKFWVIPTGLKCDADNDGDVDNDDLLIIRNANGQAASGPNDPRDGNNDGVINVADYRYCSLRKTPAH
jgi:hypothetical protein